MYKRQTWIEAKQVKINGEIADIPRAKVYGGEQIEISVEVEDVYKRQVLQKHKTFLCY